MSVDALSLPLRLPRDLLRDALLFVSSTDVESLSRTCSGRADGGATDWASTLHSLHESLLARELLGRESALREEHFRRIGYKAGTDRAFARVENDSSGEIMREPFRRGFASTAHTAWMDAAQRGAAAALACFGAVHLDKLQPPMRLETLAAAIRAANDANPGLLHIPLPAAAAAAVAAATAEGSRGGTAAAARVAIVLQTEEPPKGGRCADGNCHSACASSKEDTVAEGGCGDSKCACSDTAPSVLPAAAPAAKADSASSSLASAPPAVPLVAGVKSGVSPALLSGGDALRLLDDLLQELGVRREQLRLDVPAASPSLAAAAAAAALADGSVSTRDADEGPSPSTATSLRFSSGRAAPAAPAASSLRGLSASGSIEASQMAALDW